MVNQNAKTIATFSSNNEIIHNKPAIIINQIGNGEVTKLAFWPDSNTLYHLVRNSVNNGEMALSNLAPEAIHLVPRTDQSLFLVNTSHQEYQIEFTKPYLDRLSKKRFSGTQSVKPFAVHWLEEL